MKKVFVVTFGIFAFIILALNLIQSFFPMSPRLAHDELEHLRIILGFDRGVFPVRDFLEHHPLAFHLILWSLMKAFSFSSLTTLFAVSKAIILLHFVGTILLAGWFLQKLNSNDSKLKNSALLLIAVSMSGLWMPQAEWIWGFQSIWQIRPDWLSCFYGSLSVVCHFSALKKREKAGRARSGFFIAGGLFAFSAALMPKSLFFGLAYFATLFSVLLIETDDEEKSSQFKKGLVSVKWASIGFIAITVIYARIETWFLQINFLKYFSYVFQFNSRKHIYGYSPERSDYNPWHMTFEMWNLNLPIVLLALVSIVVALVRLSRSREDRALWATVLFSTFMLVMPMIVPAFSVGSIWPWYLIPAIPAGFILVKMGLRYLLDRKENLVFLCLFVACGWSLVQSARGSIQLARSNSTLQCFFDTSCRLPIVQDSDLPEQWTYFSFSFEGPPLKAKVLNYYSSGLFIYDFWSDYHDIKIGESPSEKFRSEYEREKPDVVYLHSRVGLSSLTNIFQSRQGIDMIWFKDDVQANYTCLNRPDEKIYVIKSKADQLSEQGWKPCSDD